MCARAVSVAAALLCAAVGPVAPADLVIVHYELFDESSPRLVAALANSVRNVRAGERDVLVLNAAGANLTGVATDVHAVGEAQVPELGAVPLLSHADGVTVAANLRLPATLRASVRPSVTVSIGGGDVGVIGVVPADLAAHPAGAEVTDAVEAVREEARSLRRRGVRTVLALGRTGGAEALQLAREVAELDALVVPGGFRKSQVYPLTVRRSAGGAVPLLEAPLVAAPGYLGMVTLTLSAAGGVAGWRGRVVPLRVPEAPAPAPAADQPAVNNKASFCATGAGEIGETLTELDGERESCSRRECALGSALADALLLAAVLPTPSSWSEVTLALLSAASLGGSLPRCSVSEADLAAVTAADTTAVALSISGKHLREAFEHSAAGHGSPDGTFLQVSGVRVVYDVTLPVGRRVRQLKVLCSECLSPRLVDVEDDVTYRLVTNSRMAEGGDGYRMFRRYGKFVADSKRLERDIYREHIRKLSPLPPPNGGRIFFLGEDGPVSEVAVAAADHPAVIYTEGGENSDDDPNKDVAADVSAAVPGSPDAAGEAAAASAGSSDATTESSSGLSATSQFFMSSLWTLGGFFTLGLLMLAFL